MFSKACEYGIRSAIYLTKQSLQEKKSSLKDVSEAVDSPEAYTSKILQLLAKRKLINSSKGPGGGFFISAKVLDKITLAHIVSAIDGDRIYTGCGLGLKKCSESRPCPVHQEFKQIRTELKNLLETSKLISLTADVRKGLTFLKQ